MSDSDLEIPCRSVTTSSGLDKQAASSACTSSSRPPDTTSPAPSGCSKGLIARPRRARWRSHRAPIQRALARWAPNAQAGAPVLVIGAGLPDLAALELVEAGLSLIVIDRSGTTASARRSPTRSAGGSTRTATTALEKAAPAPSATASCTRG